MTVRRSILILVLPFYLLLSLSLPVTLGFTTQIKIPLNGVGRSHRGPSPHAVVPTSTKKRSLPTTTTPHHRLPSTLHLTPNSIIETCVSIDTFAPQFFWLLMIAAPRSSLTKTVMEPLTPVLLLALVHLTIVLVAASQEGALAQIAIFGEVFDPGLSQLDGMEKLFAIRNFVAEEWPHVLVWDLLVGRLVWRDGLERGVDTRFSLSFCNFIGPPGLLIYAGTCLLKGKGLPTL